MRIVSVEGLEGVGKTTFAQALAKKLGERGYNTVYMPDRLAWLHTNQQCFGRFDMSDKRMRNWFALGAIWKDNNTMSNSQWIDFFVCDRWTDTLKAYLNRDMIEDAQMDFELQALRCATVETYHKVISPFYTIYMMSDPENVIERQAHRKQTDGTDIIDTDKMRITAETMNDHYKQQLSMRTQSLYLLDVDQWVTSEYDTEEKVYDRIYVMADFCSSLVQQHLSDVSVTDPKQAHEMLNKIVEQRMNYEAMLTNNTRKWRSL